MWGWLAALVALLFAVPSTLADGKVNRARGKRTNLVFVFDGSRSLDAEARATAVDIAVQIASDFPHAKFQSIWFGRVPELLWEAPLNGKNAGDLLRELKGKTPENGSNFRQAVELATSWAKRQPGRTQIVAFTDGMWPDTDLKDVNVDLRILEFSAFESEKFCLERGTNRIFWGVNETITLSSAGRPDEESIRTAAQTLMGAAGVGSVGCVRGGIWPTPNVPSMESARVWFDDEIEVAVQACGLENRKISLDVETSKAEIVEVHTTESGEFANCVVEKVWRLSLPSSLFARRASRYSFNVP